MTKEMKPLEDVDPQIANIPEALPLGARIQEETEIRSNYLLQCIRRSNLQFIWKPKTNFADQFTIYHDTTNSVQSGFETFVVIPSSKIRPSIELQPIERDQPPEFEAIFGKNARPDISFVSVTLKPYGAKTNDAEDLLKNMDKIFRILFCPTPDYAPYKNINGMPAACVSFGHVAALMDNSQSTP